MLGLLLNRAAVGSSFATFGGVSNFLMYTDKSTGEQSINWYNNTDAKRWKVRVLDMIVTSPADKT